MTEPFDDKTTWGPGLWLDEPDETAWIHAGLSCLARRGHWTGAWCGYAGVDDSHPGYGVPCDDLKVSVHGGLTFAGFLEGHTQWFLGFDCSHGWDLVPRLDAFLRGASVTPFAGTHYWTLAEVQAETNQLAEQLRQYERALMKKVEPHEQT